MEKEFPQWIQKDKAIALDGDHAPRPDATNAAFVWRQHQLSEDAKVARAPVRQETSGSLSPQPYPFGDAFRRV
jgi:hypothetical protein